MAGWLRWTLLALLSWGVWAIMAKLIGDRLSGAQNQALSTLGILPIMVALAVAGKPAAAVVRRRGIAYALASGGVSCIGNVFYYDAFSRGGKAAMIVPLTAMYPLTTIVLAMMLLKERLSSIQLGGIVLSLIAIYLFNVQREAGFFSGWLVYALAPITFWGAAGFLQKLATNHISGELSTLCFLTAFIPFAVLFLARDGLPAQITVNTWALVIAQGFLLALGNFAIQMGFASQGKASIIAPLAALYPVVSVPVAILFLGERIGTREMLGILLALGSVVALSHKRRATEPNPAASAPRTNAIT